MKSWTFELPSENEHGLRRHTSKKCLRLFVKYESMRIYVRFLGGRSNKGTYDKTMVVIAVRLTNAESITTEYECA